MPENVLEPSGVPDVPVVVDRPKMIAFRPDAETESILRWMQEYAASKGVPPHRLSRSGLIKLAVRYTYVHWAACVMEMPQWY
jgi:hypothetical protein